MNALKAIIKKEYIQVIRDIPGLIILFLMPMVLILAVTGTQENAFKKLYDNKSDILFIDNDKEYLSKTVEDGLIKSGYFHVIKELKGKNLDVTTAQNEISAGNYQVGIIINKGATENARAKAIKRIQKSFALDTLVTAEKNKEHENEAICIIYDPAIRDSYKNAVTSSLERLILSAEIKIILSTFFEALPHELNAQLQQPIKNFLLQQLEVMEGVFTEEIKNRMGEYLPADFQIDAQPREVELDMTEDIRNGIKFNDDIENENLVTVAEQYAQSGKAVIKPTLVQNNVPAFALFAMFFIVIPLAGSLLTERNEGTYNRILTLPVKYITILWGKVVVYASICLLQLLLMIVTGMYLLPLIYGMPALVLGTNYIALLCAAFSSAFAAIGFGLLVGTFASTQSQAGIFGSFMVLILAIANLDPKKFTPHKLRHTAATLMYKYGHVDIRALQEVLGHESI
ncbi:MAG: ABC transporter permease, partial [Bacteroidales bacterium]|nr:ABC transporter permease [Bacteroidales bacterium]